LKKIEALKKALSIKIKIRLSEPAKIFLVGFMLYILFLIGFFAISSVVLKIILLILGHFFLIWFARAADILKEEVI